MRTVLNRRRASALVSAVVVTGGLALAAPAPAQAASGLSVVGVQTFYNSGATVFDSSRGLTIVNWNDATPDTSHTYRLKLNPTGKVGYFDPRSLSEDVDGPWDGFYTDYTVGRHMQPGGTYQMVLEEWDGNRLVESSPTFDYTFAEVQAPSAMTVGTSLVGGRQAVVAGRATSLGFTGQWEPGTSYRTVVGVKGATAAKDFVVCQAAECVDLGLGAVGESATPVTSFTAPASMVGKTLRIQVTGVKNGRLRSTLDVEYPVVADPSMKTVPGGWITSPGKKYGVVRTGKTVGVSAPVLTATAKQKGVKTYYQWFADGKKIPGATKASYTIHPSLKGRNLTLGIQFSAPGYRPLTGGFGFGPVR